MEAVISHSSSDKSQTVRTHKRILNRQASNFVAGILPSPPLINHSLSSYPPFSSHKKQPPLLPLPLPLPVPGPSLVRNSSINPLVNRGLSLPPINTKPNKNNIATSNSSIIAAPPRKSTSSSLSTTFKPLKQTTAKPASTGGFSKDIGGSRAMCHVQGTRSLSKTEQASPKLLTEMDKVGDFGESVVFTLSPPPSSLPMPSFSILRPKLGCGC